MKFIYNDGGRSAAGYKGYAGDCAVRAVCIVTGKPYNEVYDAINCMAKSERIGKRKKRKSNSRTGVYSSLLRKYLGGLQTVWVPTMQVGSGCKVHVREGELPKGKLVLRLSRHYTAVIDGVLQDTYDCSRGGDRCVYGYWKLIAND